MTAPSSDVECTLSVVLPARNERETVEFLIYALIGILEPRFGDAFEILVVDDSTDDSFSLLEDRHARMRGAQRVRLFHREEGTGLATAIEYGIERARGDYLALMNADFNHSPADLPRLFDRIQECDMAVGSRFQPGGGMLGASLRWYGSRLFNLFVRSALGLKTRDNLSGFWLMRRSRFLELAEGADLFHGYGDYFIRMLQRAEQLGLKVGEVPVVYLRRVSGESKTRFVHELINYTRTVWSLRNAKP